MQKYCLVCGKPISPFSKYCYEHAINNNHRRKPIEERKPLKTYKEYLEKDSKLKSIKQWLEERQMYYKK